MNILKLQTESKKKLIMGRLFKMVFTLDSFVKQKEKVCYTWGYGGKNEQELIKTLMFLKKEHKQPVIVIDVRYTPFCRWNPFFTIDKLRKLVVNQNCNYLHAKGLGNPERTLDGTYHFLRCSNYDFSPILSSNILLLLCSEKKYERCHRKHIAQYLKTFHFYKIKNL